MNKLSYERIAKRPQLFHRLTGLTLPEFDRLLDKFVSQYNLLVIQPRLQSAERQRSAGGGRHGQISSPADKLFFILVYVRIYPLLIFHGLLFGMNEGCACRWVGILLPVLKAALGSAHALPERIKGRSLEEIIKEYPELMQLGVLTDGVERPIRRPKDNDKQEQHYSGKKKRHTSKHVTFVHPKTQYILAVSDEHPGRDHDKKIIDEEQIDCRSPIDIGADSGFVGLTIGQANVILPVKRKPTKQGQPKNGLTAEQKAYNKALSQSRIQVEHSNAGFKRNRSVADILRNTTDGISDRLAMVAMGLHNLRVTMRASYQGC